MNNGAKISAGFVIGLAAILILGGSAYLSTQHLLEANRRATRTRDVLGHFEHLLSSMKDAETGQRGFILTGKQRYLAPYEAAVQETPKDLESLETLAGDDAAQQEKLGQIRSLVDAKFAELRESLAIYRKSGKQAALDFVLADHGIQIMNDLRDAIASVRLREERLLASQNDAADASAGRTLWTIAFWTPLALLLMVIAIVATLRYSQPDRPAAPHVQPLRKWLAPAVRYACSAFLVALATVLQYQLRKSFGPVPPFIAFYPAVFLVVSVAGCGAGLFATILAALAVDYWFIMPLGFGITATNDVLSMGIFVGVCVLFSLVMERLQLAHWAQAFGLAREESLREHSDELLRQNEELTQQSEEISQQSEEILQQSEELAQQNEELQTQSEEIKTLNAELQTREDMLQKMLDSARKSADEQAVLQDICAAALDLFGQVCAVAVVYERQNDQLIIRAHAGLGASKTNLESWPAAHSFAELVMSENRTAALEDASLRDDLVMLCIPGEKPFQSVLAAPMRIGGHPFGVMSIYSRQPQEWTTVQFRMVEWLATQSTHILEILRLQEALRDSEQRYRALFNSMTEGFALHEILCDENGEPCDYRFLDINPAFEALTGLNRGRVVGHTYKEILPDDDPRWLQVYGQVAITGQPAQFDNYSPALKKHFQVFAFRPALLQFAVIFIDVTERKQADETLRRAADDLARSNKDLEQFAYVISHDLKEPLRMVTGFMSLLQERCQGQLDAKADQYIFYASDAAVRMQGMIDDLLAYSRVGRGNGVETTDLNALLGRVLKSLSVSIEESGATITFDSLPSLAANPIELTQVFQNLIGNALKFRGAGRPEIHIGAAREDGRWIFSVRDNGIGIDPKFADRVFMIFQRLHSREEYPGTGIGLAICRKIVERHGGRIWIESEPGNGSTFRFTIPDARKS